jgi:aryl-alcohol dehydrogenase-like predicted oxidoreductase
VSLGTAAARGIDRAETSRALHAALEAGVEHVDIAVDDDTERLVGDTIRALRLRDKARAAPRIPALRTTPSGATTRDTLIDRLPPRYVTARVEAALRTTRLDALPLAQLELRAAWRSSSAWPEVAGTCARLVREGKVLAWGAYVERTEEDTGELAREAWLTTLAIPFSLCERAHVDAIFASARSALEVPAQTSSQQQHLFDAGLSPELVIAAGLPPDLILAAIPPSSTPGVAAPPKAARETPMAIHARRPLAGGALAGSLGPGAKLKQRDDRNALSPGELDRIAIAVARLARFAKNPPPAARANESAQAELERSLRNRREPIDALSVAELALRYVITKGAIALPRLHRHEHVLDSVAASLAPPLPPDLIETVEQLDI